MAKGKQNRSHQVLPPLNRSLRSQATPTSAAELPNLSEECQSVVEFLLAKLEEQRVAFTEKLEEKEKTMQNLSKENAALKKRVVSLEEQAEDLSVSSRNNDIIVSGDRLPASTTGENCPAVVADTIKREVNYEIDASKIASAYRVGKKSPSQGLDKRKIVVKLSNGVNRTDLIQACKRVKPPGLFVNESLTPLKSRILFAVRQAKRRYPARVSGCGSHDGRVFA